jgi:hypothetical protein
MTIRKTVKTTASALAVSAAVLAFSGPAAGQLVLSCYTLHNDLANFDRRASVAHNFFLPRLERARREASDAAERSADAFCFDSTAEDCGRALADKAETYRRLREAYLLSHLGGSDLVRLRIIGEMRKLGCPLPDHVVELLQILDSKNGPARSGAHYPNKNLAGKSPLK